MNRSPEKNNFLRLILCVSKRVLERMCVWVSMFNFALPAVFADTWQDPKIKD